MVIALRFMPLYIQLTKYQFQWSNETHQVKVMEVDTTLLWHLGSLRLGQLFLPNQNHIFLEHHHCCKEDWTFSNLCAQFYVHEGTRFLWEGLPWVFLFGFQWKWLISEVTWVNDLNTTWRCKPCLWLEIRPLYKFSWC